MLWQTFLQFRPESAVRRNADTVVGILLDPSGRTSLETASRSFASVLRKGDIWLAGDVGPSDRGAGIDTSGTFSSLRVARTCAPLSDA
jgi:hypothetical protein